VTFVAYSPLGRGFLTGSFTSAERELTSDDSRRHHPRFNGENAEANARLVAAVGEVAAARQATAAQVALAWVQQRAAVWELPVVPIPGTRKRTRLEENLAATRIELSEDELARLEPLAERVAGQR